MSHHKRKMSSFSYRKLISTSVSQVIKENHLDSLRTIINYESSYRPALFINMARSVRELYFSTYGDDRINTRHKIINALSKNDLITLKDIANTLDFKSFSVTVSSMAALISISSLVVAILSANKLFSTVWGLFVLGGVLLGICTILKEDRTKNTTAFFSQLIDEAIEKKQDQ